jgi:hypothetical protein
MAGICVDLYHYQVVTVWPKDRGIKIRLKPFGASGYFTYRQV